MSITAAVSCGTHRLGAASDPLPLVALMRTSASKDPDEAQSGRSTPAHWSRAFLRITRTDRDIVASHAKCLTQCGSNGACPQDGNLHAQHHLRLVRL